jgi:hypothetical protein
MNHQAIEFLARERIDRFQREAAGLSLADAEGSPERGSRFTLLRALGGRLRASVGARAGALATGARAVARNNS